MPWMTWRLFARVQRYLSVAFAALAGSALVLTLSGRDRGGYLSVVLIGGLSILAQWHGTKARRHEQNSDPDPTSWRDLVQRL
jgi:hypothetical protein